MWVLENSPQSRLAQGWLTTSEQSELENQFMSPQRGTPQGRVLSEWPDQNLPFLQPRQGSHIYYPGLLGNRGFWIGQWLMGMECVIVSVLTAASVCLQWLRTRWAGQVTSLGHGGGHSLVASPHHERTVPFGLWLQLPSWGTHYVLKIK